jgi:hypothetical protein
MAPFAVSAPCGAGGIGLCGVNRDDFELGVVEEELEFAGSGFAEARFEDDSGLDDGGRGDETNVGRGDPGEEEVALGLVEEDGDDGRGVDDHRALLGQAVLVVAQDVVFGAPIEDGEGVDAVDDLIQALGAQPDGVALAQAGEALFEGMADGVGEGFACSLRYLPRKALGFFVLDA